MKENNDLTNPSISKAINKSTSAFSYLNILKEMH